MWIKMSILETLGGYVESGSDVLRDTAEDLYEYHLRPTIDYGIDLFHTYEDDLLKYVTGRSINRLVAQYSRMPEIIERYDIDKDPEDGIKALRDDVRAFCAGEEERGLISNAFLEVDLPTSIISLFQMLTPLGRYTIPTVMAELTENVLGRRFRGIIQKYAPQYGLPKEGMTRYMDEAAAIGATLERDGGSILTRGLQIFAQLPDVGFRYVNSLADYVLHYTFLDYIGVKPEALPEQTEAEQDQPEQPFDLTNVLETLGEQLGVDPQDLMERLYGELQPTQATT